MALKPNLDLRMTTALTMTPQMLQSVKLLQMTSMELEHFIDQELEKNPLLERVENSVSRHNEQDEKHQEPAQIMVADNEPMIDGESLSQLFDTGIENIYPDDGTPTLSQNHREKPEWREPQTGAMSFEDADILQNLAARPTLRDYIHEQISFAFLDPHHRFIAYDLADQLDEAGYFSGQLSETAKRLSCQFSDVAEVFTKLQNFDPAGIFACSLAECLALQLKQKNRYDPAMVKLIDHLPALGKRNYEFLARICDVDNDDLVEMVEEIRALDPKPGLAFGKATADLVVPDVLIHQLPNGVFHVELNADILPRIVMHRHYSTKICANKIERNFINDCLQSANWLLRALDQRAKTLLKVTSEIARHQEEFLKHGIAHLKPLNLITLAQAVGLHESTISRVTANKFIATPRGTFEMRKFFSIALNAHEGQETHAADAVRHRIKQMIDKEETDKVLSDDALVALLAQENIIIARRTVMKYREAMNIPSSIQRRREKKIRLPTTKS